MTAFVLKVVAMVTMTIDHIGYGFLTDVEVLRIIGRCAFLIYAFLIAESYYQLRDKPDRIRYHIVKLVLLMVVSEVPYDLFDVGKIANWKSQSVMPTLLLGFLAVYLADLVTTKVIGKADKTISESMMERSVADIYANSIRISLRLIIYFCIALISYYTMGNYRFSGVLLIVAMYHYLQMADKLGKPMRVICLLGILLLYWMCLMWVRIDFGSLSDLIAECYGYRSRLIPHVIMSIPFAFYNRKQGYRSRAFDVGYSLYYPVHQFILYLIKVLI